MTAACVGMIACSKDGTGDNPYADGSKQVVLKVNLPATRAVDGTWLDDQGNPKETNISSIDVFFTNANGTVKNRYTLNTVNGYLDDVQGDGLRFVGLKDVTAVYIAANVPESMIENITTMADFKVLMNQQAPSMEQDNMIFAGCDMDLIAGADTDASIPTYDDNPDDNQAPTGPAAGDMMYTADVVIRPIISRIEWGNITVDEEGSKEFKQPDGSTYLVEWSGYAPTIVGVYQSNVYLAENIFGTTQASALFATPANWTSIVNGAWVEPTPSIDGITWDNVNPSLAYSNYQADGYAKLLPDGYNEDKQQCVPFHFFVPFDPTSSNEDNTAITGDMDGKLPQWHFQLYYPDDRGYTITVKKKNAGEGDDKYTVVTDDKALSLMGDFLYPAGRDKIAYANVVKLKDNTGNNDLTYRPGMIYTADIEIYPYNVSLGFEDKDNYNVIVKVGVADFATQKVTPEFDK